jgi:hypothetical protein
LFISAKTAKELISQDLNSNTYSYKFTVSVEIAPICKDDLICLPLQIARSCGNISPLVVCHKMADAIHFLDPLTLKSKQTLFSLNDFQRYLLGCTFSWSSHCSYLLETTIQICSRQSTINQICGVRCYPFSTYFGQSKLPEFVHESFSQKGIFSYVIPCFFSLSWLRFNWLEKEI